jgi:GH24 family phage-related lysozyme (muramidase)
MILNFFLNVIGWTFCFSTLCKLLTLSDFECTAVQVRMLKGNKEEKKQKNRRRRMEERGRGNGVGKEKRRMAE